MGDKVVEDKWGVNQRLVFMYDENGAPNTVYYYNGSTSATKYYYVLNLQGDVTEIRSTSNALVAQYNYDAFGNILSIKDANGNNITSSTHIANVNPLRYRGYFYDTETGFYYLNSRYYDPATRRFISADTIIDGRDFDGMNLYAYCWNNPVTHTDASGNIVTNWDLNHLSASELKYLELYTNEWRSASPSQRAILQEAAAALRAPYLNEGDFVGTNGYVYNDITARLDLAMAQNANDFLSEFYWGELPKLISFIQKSKNGAEWDLKRIWSLDKDVIYLYREIECRYMILESYIREARYDN